MAFLNNWGKGKSKPADWEKWWKGNSLAEVWRTTVVDEFGGHDAFTEDEKARMVINMYQALSAGMTQDDLLIELRKFIGTTASGKKYINARDSFVQGVKDLVGTKYDKSVYTDDKLAEMFNTRVKQGGGDLANVGDITARIGTVIGDDFNAKVKAGTIDADTGELLSPGAAAENIQKIKDMTAGMGFSLSDAGYEYYGDLLRKGTKAYEIEQMVKGSAEYAEYELDKARKEYETSLDPLLAKELDNLKLVDKSSQESVLKSFEKLAPEITKYAGTLGGTDRAYTTQALSAQAGDLETARQEYLTQVEASIRSNDVSRRYLSNEGRLSDAQNVSQYSAAQGIQLFNDQINNQKELTSQLKSLSLNTSSTLAQMAQDRYNNELAKEAKRLEAERANAIKAAYKKAGKFGLFGSTLQGITSGAMAGGQAGGPWGAVAGGIIGGGLGYAQGDANRRSQNAQAETGQSGLYGNYNTNASSVGGYFGGLFGNNNSNSSGYEQNMSHWYNGYQIA